MARPTRIESDDILRAAREVFLEKGYAEATTAEIARRASVSEGTLFKRFREKSELFRAAMQVEVPPAFGQLLDRVGQGDLEANLAEMGQGLIAFFVQTVIPNVMMSWSNRSLLSPGPKANHPAVHGMRLLKAYFAAEMKTGRLKAGEPETLARIFAGALWHYALLRVVAPGESAMSPEAFALDLAAFIGRGARP